MFQRLFVILQRIIKTNTKIMHLFKYTKKGKHTLHYVHLIHSIFVIKCFEVHSHLNKVLTTQCLKPSAKWLYAWFPWTEVLRKCMWKCGGRKPLHTVHHIFLNWVKVIINICNITAINAPNQKQVRLYVIVPHYTILVLWTKTISFCKRVIECSPYDVPLVQCPLSPYWVWFHGGFYFQ